MPWKLTECVPVDARAQAGLHESSTVLTNKIEDDESVRKLKESIEQTKDAAEQVRSFVCCEWSSCACGEWCPSSVSPIGCMCSMHSYVPVAKWRTDCMLLFLALGGSNTKFVPQSVANGRGCL